MAIVHACARAHSQSRCGVAACGAQERQRRCGENEDTCGMQNDSRPAKTAVRAAPMHMSLSCHLSFPHMAGTGTG